MIPCQSCGAENPIGTRYCRACGTKLEVQQAQVFSAVKQDIAKHAADRWLQRGRSMLMIGAFLLTAALAFLYAVVPELPPAVVPLQDAGPVVPDISAAAAPVPAAPPAPAR
jgi:hypothetical protein